MTGISQGPGPGVRITARHRSVGPTALAGAHNARATILTRGPESQGTANRTSPYSRPIADNSLVCPNVNFFIGTTKVHLQELMNIVNDILLALTVCNSNNVRQATIIDDTSSPSVSHAKFLPWDRTSPFAQIEAC